MTVEAVLTTGTLTSRAEPPAMLHVRRAEAARRARASRALAQRDSAGDAERVLTYVYASTPPTLMRPGALAEHCGLSDARAAEVLADLVERGYLTEGSTVLRAGVFGPRLAARPDECASG